MITIEPFTLSRLVAQAKPHMAGQGEPESLQVLMFDFDGTYLHLCATNRYTLGVSRTKAHGADEPWMATVGRRQVLELEAAIRLLNARPVSIERTPDSLLLSGETGTRIAITLSVFDGYSKWRDVLRTALDAAPSSAQMAMTPKYFAAWKNLPGPVQMWSSGESKPVLISAPDFLGLQMPVRRNGEDVTLQRELSSWKAVVARPIAAAA